MPLDLGYNGGLTISFQTKDRKKTSAWYAEMLGFQLLYDVEQIGWCEMGTHVKGVNVGFAQNESPATKGPVPTWGVKDLDAARTKLEKKDVKFDGPTITMPGMVKLATFFDPDGNANMLFQDLSGHS